MTKEALKLALEALEAAKELAGKHDAELEYGFQHAITAIKKALAQPVQEPVAYLTRRKIGGTEGLLRADMVDKSARNQETHDFIPLYTTPPQRKPLTDEQILEMWGLHDVDPGIVDFVRAVEAAHGIKEKT